MQFFRQLCNTVLWPCFWDYLGEPVPEEIFSTLWCKGRYHRQTHRQYLELSSDPPPSSPIFTLGALPAATLPIYLGLGQARNRLQPNIGFTFEHALMVFTCSDITAECKPIWMKSGALWVYRLGLALRDFGCDGISESWTARRNFVFFVR